MKYHHRQTDLASWLDDLVGQGRRTFTTEEAHQIHGGTEKAVQGCLRRLRLKGFIASPLRGFHMVVPPEYRRLGCLPALWFVDDLAEHLGVTYYVALLSAAELHGAAHQRPQVFQIMLPRTHRAVRCGGVRLAFAMRGNLDEVPVLVRNTPTGTVRIASPELTAFDLVGYPALVGGLGGAAVVLAELAETLDGTALTKMAPLCPVPWAQRLGWLLDRVGALDSTGPLAEWVAARRPPTCALDVEHTVRDAPRSDRWRLVENVIVEVDP